MARLDIQQVQAPNMSAAGNMLAQAGESFDRGLSSASSVLGKYQEGQKAAGDAALIQAMLDLEDETQVGDFLAKNDLSKMNLSEDMRKSALGLRNQLISNAQGRANVTQTEAQTGLVNANTRNIDGRLSLAQAAGEREAAEYGYNTRRRDELSAAASGYANALTAGQQYGNGSEFSAAINATESGGGADQYDTLYGHRNRDNGVRVSQMNLGQLKEFSSVDGAYGQSVNQEIGRVATPMGKYQIVGTTLRSIQEDLKLPDTIQFNPAVQELMGTYLGQRRVQGNGTQAQKRDGLRAEWEGFANKSDAELDVIINELQNTPPVTRDQIMAAGSNQMPANPLSPAQQQLAQAVAQGSTFTFDDIDRMFGGVSAAQAAGQAQLDQTEADRVRNSQAQSILSAVNSPDVLTPAGVVAAATSNPNISPAERLASASLAQDAAQGPLGGILSPQVAADPLLAAQTESDARTRQRAIDALPQTSLIATAERYGNDPVNGLINDLGIGEDGETPGTLLFEWLGESGDENLLRQYIREIAEDTGVTQAMAAAVMRDVFERDPLFGNTNDRRFDPDKVRERIRTTVGPEGMHEYEDALVQNTTRTGRNEALQLQIQTMESQLSKTNDPRRRQQLQAQINQAKDQALMSATPQEAADFFRTWMRESASGGRLRGLDPESADYFRALGDIQTEIERDDNLTDRQKSLLISQLPS